VFAEEEGLRGGGVFAEEEESLRRRSVCEEESRSRAEARWITGGEGMSFPPAEAGGKEVPAEAGRNLIGT